MPSKSESFVFKTPYSFKKITKLKRKPCAKEGENCKCNGRIYFGTWKSIMINVKQDYAFKDSKRVGKCTNTQFGVEKRGYKRKCYC